MILSSDELFKEELRKNLVNDTNSSNREYIEENFADMLDELQELVSISNICW